MNYIFFLMFCSIQMINKRMGTLWMLQTKIFEFVTFYAKIAFLPLILCVYIFSFRNMGLWSILCGLILFCMVSRRYHCILHFLTKTLGSLSWKDNHNQRVMTMNFFVLKSVWFYYRLFLFLQTILCSFLINFTFDTHYCFLLMSLFSKPL